MTDKPIDSINEVRLPSRRSGKFMEAKRRWIEETQRFQRIARNGESFDSDEVLGQEYDDMMTERSLRRYRDVQVGSHDVQIKEGVRYKGTKTDFTQLGYNSSSEKWPDYVALAVDAKGNITKIPAIKKDR